MKEFKDFHYFTGNNNICLRLKSANIPINSHSYKFSISRGSYTYNSFKYKTSNNTIIFDSY